MQYSVQKFGKSALLGQSTIQANSIVTLDVVFTSVNYPLALTLKESDIDGEYIYNYLNK